MGGGGGVCVCMCCISTGFPTIKKLKFHKSFAHYIYCGHTYPTNNNANLTF